MVKTLEKAEATARSARDSLATGIEETRRSTANILESIGGGIRRRSRRAGRVTEKTVRRIGDTLESNADLVRGRPRSPVGYARRHPVQALLGFGLMAGLLALIALPLLMKRRTTKEGEFEGFGPF